MKKIVLVGAGGHCKVIIDIIKSMDKYEIIGITDIKVSGKLLDIPIIGNDTILQGVYDSGVDYAFIGIGALYDINMRNIIYSRLESIGFKLPVLIHKNSIVSPYAHVGDGTCVMAGAVVNASACIGENCIINTGSVIEHDCIVGDNTHISPNASVAGATKIGYNTHIGIGSSIIQGISIGNNVTVGAGAVVIDDIPDNVVSVGIPSRIIKLKE